MNEKMEILKMLEQGKINAEEAQKLLEALGDGSQESIKMPKMNNNLKGKMFRIRILAKDDDNVEINVNVPISLFKLGLKMSSSNMLQVNGSSGFQLSDEDFDAIMEAANNGETGEIFTLDSDEVQIKIYID